MAAKVEEVDLDGVYVIVADGERASTRSVDRGERGKMEFMELAATLVVPGQPLLAKVSLSWRDSDDVLAPGVHKVLFGPAVALGDFGRPEVRWRDVRFSAVEVEAGTLLQTLV